MKVQNKFIQFFPATRIEDKKTVYYSPLSEKPSLKSEEFNGNNVGTPWLEIDGVGKKAETLLLFSTERGGKHGWLDHLELPVDSPVFQSLFNTLDKIVKVFSPSTPEKRKSSSEESVDQKWGFNEEAKSTKFKTSINLTPQDILKELEDSGFKTINIINELANFMNSSGQKQNATCSPEEIALVKKSLAFINREELINKLKSLPFSRLDLYEVLRYGSFKKYFDEGVIKVEDLTDDEHIISLLNKIRPQDLEAFHEKVSELSFAVYNALDASDGSLAMPDELSFLSQLAKNDQNKSAEQIKSMLQILGGEPGSISHNINSVADTIKQAFYRSYLPLWMVKKNIHLSSMEASELAGTIRSLPFAEGFIEAVIGKKGLGELIALSLKLHEDGLGGRNIIRSIIEQGLEKANPEKEVGVTRINAQWAVLTKEWVDPITGLKLVPLDSKQSLEEVGKKLDQCVGQDPSYAIDSRKGRHSIYSIVNINGDPLSTVQINTSITKGKTSDKHQLIKLSEGTFLELSIAQHASKHNGQPPPEALTAVASFLKSLELKDIDKEYVQSAHAGLRETDDNFSEEILERIGYDPLEYPEITRELWRYFSGDNMAYERNDEGNFKLDENNKRIPIMEVQYQTDSEGRWILDGNQNRMPIIIQNERGERVPLVKHKREYPDLYPNKDINERAVYNEHNGRWTSPKVNKNFPFLGNNKRDQTPEDFWGL